METDQTDTAKPTCNFPDCERPVKTCGLCAKHYFQATRAATPAVREKAASFMAAPTRGPGVGKGKKPHRKKPIPQVTPPKALHPRSPEDEGTRAELRPEDPRATADELFHALGAQAVKIPSKGGVLYFMPEAFRVIWVGPSGGVHRAEIHAGPSKELII